MNTILIAGNKWYIKNVTELVNDDGYILAGDCDYDNRIINININKEHNTDYNRSLFHEICHAFIFESGYKFILDFIPGLEESLVRAMEHILYPTLKVFYAKKERA